MDLLVARLDSFGYEAGAQLSDTSLIPAHSYLMQSWVWAGFMGGLFWIGVGWISVRLLTSLYLVRMDLSPLLVSSAVGLLWGLAFSPYGQSTRITAMYAIVLCLLGLRLMATGADVGNPLGPGGRDPHPTHRPSWRK